MSDINSPKFGIEIREQLYQLDITQTELAARLGITAAYLNDILMNKRFARQRRKQILEAVKEMKKKKKKCNNFMSLD